MQQPYLPFLRSQKVMAIACHNGDELWIANVYIGVDDHALIYFISSEDTKHCSMILQNPQVAFSLSWFDAKNHGNRKGIQATGVCRPAESEEEILQGLLLHNKNYPEFKDRITREWLREAAKRKVWVVTAKTIKYWDDELYGEKGWQNF
mgnify:CR=1 FL=1